MEASRGKDARKRASEMEVASKTHNFLIGHPQRNGMYTNIIHAVYVI